MDVPTVKKRWKYLKDCYMKDKKKTNVYIPSGSAASVTRKSSFRFYEAMSFLSDCMETRQTVSTLSTNLVPSQILQPSQSSPTVSPTNADYCSSNNSSNNSCNLQLPKKRKSPMKDVGNLDETFIATLMSEPAQNDPTHFYALSLADGLRRLPYKERAKLQIEFLSRVMEVQTELDS